MAPNCRCSVRPSRLSVHGVESGNTEVEPNPDGANIGPVLAEAGSKSMQTWSSEVKKTTPNGKPPRGWRAHQRIRGGNDEGCAERAEGAGRPPIAAREQRLRRTVREPVRTARQLGTQTARRERGRDKNEAKASNTRLRKTVRETRRKPHQQGDQAREADDRGQMWRRTAPRTTRQPDWKRGPSFNTRQRIRGGHKLSDGAKIGRFRP